jgi:hypothetical protein
LPLKGFKCPSNGEQPGRDNTYDYCFYQCQNKCMPKAMLYKFAEQHVGNVHKGDMITPSALKGCTRKLVLERTTDYYAEPPRLYYAVRGSLIHGFLENQGLKDVHTEVRLFKKFNALGKEFVISGQVDMYDEREHVIEDYKTASDKAFYFLFDTGAKEEHILQTNTYRWLCNGGHLGSLDGPQVNWPVKRIILNYLLMNQVISTGRTHVERVTGYKEPNMGKKYRLEKSRKKVGKNHRGTPIWEIQLDIPEVPLMPEGEIFKHIELNGLKTLQGFKVMEAGNVPDGVLYDRDGAWMCGYCDVKSTCFDHERQNNTVQFMKFYNEDERK